MDIFFPFRIASALRCRPDSLAVAVTATVAMTEDQTATVAVIEAATEAVATTEGGKNRN